MNASPSSLTTRRRQWLAGAAKAEPRRLWPAPRRSGPSRSRAGSCCCSFSPAERAVRDLGSQTGAKTRRPLPFHPHVDSRDPHRRVAAPTRPESCTVSPWCAACSRTSRIISRGITPCNPAASRGGYPVLARRWRNCWNNPATCCRATFPSAANGPKAYTDIGDAGFLGAKYERVKVYDNLPPENLVRPATISPATRRRRIVPGARRTNASAGVAMGGGRLTPTKRPSPRPRP